MTIICVHLHFCRLLKKMICIKKECVFEIDNEGESALHWAAEAGSFEAAKAICDAAPSVDEIKTM